jgi:hypothetical protein
VGGATDKRGFSWRALLPVVILAPLFGAVAVQILSSAGAAVATPAATAAVSRVAVLRPIGPSTGPASSRSGSLGVSATGAASLPSTGSPDSALASVGSGGPPSYIADPTTEGQVAQDLIAALDSQSKGLYVMAATADNVTLLDSWMDNEGGLWADNPLNTSLDAARFPHQISTSGQNTGIPIFPTIALGVNLTATTLLLNHAYAPILSVLSEGGASCLDFARAVIDSPWAASHYGHDPSRFCGATGGSGSVPAVSPCLRLPARTKSGQRGARVPGACGRFGAHHPVAGPSRAGHRVAVAAHRTAPRHTAAHRHSGSRSAGGGHAAGGHASGGHASGRQARASGGAVAVVHHRGRSHR